MWYETQWTPVYCDGISATHVNGHAGLHSASAICVVTYSWHVTLREAVIRRVCQVKPPRNGVVSSRGKTKQSSVHGIWLSFVSAQGCHAMLVRHLLDTCFSWNFSLQAASPICIGSLFEVITSKGLPPSPGWCVCLHSSHTVTFCLGFLSGNVSRFALSCHQSSLTFDLFPRPGQSHQQNCAVRDFFSHHPCSLSSLATS